MRLREAAAFFRNSFSIRSRRNSSSISRILTRSVGDNSGSGVGFSFRHAFTQFPNVPSLIANSRAISATGRSDWITNCTASALN